MLHEVLLALSGHPSPLFGDREDGQYFTQDEDFQLISPSERALLRSIGRLSGLHRKLKRHLESISSSHRSIICRAVSTSIQQTHLDRFQQRILDVETKILKKDAGLVGAYEIVPLASVVGEFDDWHRRMAWYWEVACFIASPKEKGSPRTAALKASGPCTSARLIDRLRAETQTGFPEIEEAATELACIAETAWLRQLSSWMIHGKLPAFGAQDFFIHADDSQTRTFRQDKDLLPGFVNPSTASSILFIGKSLHQVQRHRRQAKSVSFALSRAKTNESDLANQHLRQLASLQLPVIASQLSRAVFDIRLSLSQNVLQHLLPMGTTLQALSSLRQYFLLDCGGFAVAIINEAESRMQSRQHRLLQQDPVKALQGLSVNDAELHQALQVVWRSIAARDVDETLEDAQKHISWTVPKASNSRPSTADGALSNGPELSSVAFNNLLFPSPTELNLSFSSPLDLFLSPRDMAIYTTISSYLLAIRRGHQRLSDLWRRSSARRDRPSSSAQRVGAQSRRNKHNGNMRKVWASCSAAIFMLSETSAFFEGEIIKGSYDHFLEWVQKPAEQEDFDHSRTSTRDGKDEDKAQRDPETLSSGHRTFLAGLTYSLLLTDTTYTKELRSLLGNVDNLIAFFGRLLDVQQKLNHERQASGEQAYTVEEEQRITLELDRARKKVDSDLKSVINRLRQLNHDRIGSLRYLDVPPGGHGDFEIWKGGGVDRLLMKLEFGRMVDGGFNIV